ncbi:peptidase, M48 family [Synechococcus sp. PCC 7335]|uniref:M48 family metalloprotease n=1 Tax=Synechococcus sp. (strain ATCC 29403 / PCC 7335) TaxID=91464 RepID=UPI00017EDC77|nr:M48 family metalloprotease [Synechococcus sp. PCC 7335]EDX84942.1 peptidase, M48 family [Synechococcus sp. PCC 7335]
MEKGQLKTVALLSLLSGLLVVIGYALYGGTGALLGLGIAAVTNFGSWFYSDQIALKAYNAQPVTRAQLPEIYSMVERLAAKAEIPMPDVYLVPGEAANAFATGRDPEHAAVAVTQGIVRALSTEELEGVLAHELTHIINRDTLTQAVAATIGGAITFLAQMLQYSMFFGGNRDREGNGANPIALMATIFLAPMAATVIQMGISRTREFAADAGAAQLTGNPRALATALKRLEASAQRMPMNANPAFEPLLIINAVPQQMMRSLFSTHPSTDDRVARLLELEQTQNIKGTPSVGF